MAERKRGKQKREKPTTIKQKRGDKVKRRELINPLGSLRNKVANKGGTRRTSRRKSDKIVESPHPFILQQVKESPPPNLGGNYYYFFIMIQKLWVVCPQLLEGDMLPMLMGFASQ